MPTMGVRWKMNTAKTRRSGDPAIRPRETALLIVPLTMASKRTEDDEPVNVRKLYDNLIKQLNEIRLDNPNYR